jgi:coenzyme F420 hydrogenase subunit beta
MPYDELQKLVLDTNLCASCGACYTICPKDAIEMGPLLPGLAASFSGDECGECNDCLQVCPGYDTGTPASEEVLFGRTRRHDERWLGIVQDTQMGYSTNAELFEVSASGGTATALLQAAMLSLGLDCVIVAGRNADRPWLAESAVCYDPDDLVKYTQSTYQLFPHLTALKQVLLNPAIRKIGISGLACHIQAVRNAQRSDSWWGQRFRDALVFCLEIACSSNTKAAGTETLITQLMKVHLDDVKEIKFRDGDYPGQVLVRLKSGEATTLPFWQAVRHFKDHKTHRCLSCGDWMSGLADVSVCDGDPNIFLSSQNSDPPPKHGIMLVRTNTGRDVLNWARQNNRICARPASMSGPNLGLERKRNRRAFYAESGMPVPLDPIPAYRDEIDPIDDENFIPSLEEAVKR